MDRLPVTPLPRITFECLGGAACAMDTPGHGIGPIQHRVSAATPSKWRDHLVESVSAEGWVRLRSLNSDGSVLVWNHGFSGETLEVGTPVSLHATYHVLAVGTERLNVLVLDAA